MEYNDKLRLAKEALSSGSYDKDTIEHIFPELAESEDERIRKWIRKELESKYVVDNIVNNVIADKALAWLEKHSEQKLADKVEPKFKVGDWVVNTVCDTNQIVKVFDNGYTLDDNTFISNSWATEHYHLWTIQDAKDGDVLAFYSEYRGNKMVQVGIIEKYVGKHDGCSDTFKIYVGVNWDNNLQTGEYMGCSDIRPATKEQRDALMKAMSDAGYTFDFEKKELKKIHVIDEGKAEMDYCFTKMMNDEKVSSAWSEEDNIFYKGIISHFEKELGDGTLETECSDKQVVSDLRYCYKKNINWLKSLKDRVQTTSKYVLPQRKEGEPLIYYFERCVAKVSPSLRELAFDVVKEIKTKHWKPSDEQMAALSSATGDSTSTHYSATLHSLYNDLKKLRNE